VGFITFNLLLKEALSLAMELNLQQQKLLFLILVQEKNRFYLNERGGLRIVEDQPQTYI
jgi:hypothetical protein